MRAGAFFLYYHHPPYYFFRTIAPRTIAPCTIALRTIAPCVFEPSPLVVFGLARSVLAWFDVLGKPLSFSIYSSLGIAVPCELFCLAYSLRIRAFAP